MKGVIHLKIHIVQKGETLWEIAELYEVDVEELKQLNSQLSSPDMLMPGMKIKIPSPSKNVKKKKARIEQEEKQANKTEKKIKERENYDTLKPLKTPHLSVEPLTTQTNQSDKKQEKVLNMGNKKESKQKQQEYSMPMSTMPVYPNMVPSSPY